MKKVLIVFFVLLCMPLMAQYQDYKIKELYDVIYKQSNDYLGENVYDNSTAYTSDTTFGNLERIGNIIESNIVMYETTKDKAYLIKAVNKSIEMINKRGGPYTPGQTNFTYGNGWQNMLCNSDCYIPNVPGVLLWSMAHLCHLILYDEPQLCSLPLPSNLIIPSTSNPAFISTNTYGLFADWLVRRCVESLDWYLSNFWLGPNEGFREEDNINHGGGVNQQAPFAAAFFYLGHLSEITPCFAYQGFYSGLASYMQRATELANLFAGTIKIFNNISLPINSPICFERPVFNHIVSTNSYWWMTTGWGFNKQYRLACLSDRVNYSDYIDIGSGNNQNSIEDISHGIRTLIFPRICYKYNFITGGNPYFDVYDMFRFRNTFTNVIWDGNMNNPEFYYTVRGAGYNSYASTSSCNPCTNEDSKWVALNWMPFQEFDFIAGNSLTYQIIMQHFYNIRNDIIIGGPGNFINGGKMLALAEMVKAQWQKECVNTTLYKRILPYNQDFFVKNILTIAPQDELPQIYSHSDYNADNSYSMADPLTQDKKFTIEPGVTCNMKAGERIVLKPGFHAKAGSNFRAYIESNLCTDGQIAPPGGGGNNEPNYDSWVAQANTKSIKQQEEHSAQKTTNTSLNEQQNNFSKQEFNILPNPNNGIFSIFVQTLNEQEQLQLSVMDVYGKQILNQHIANSVNHTIDLSAYSKGIYYVSVTGNSGFREVKKVVVN